MKQAITLLAALSLPLWSQTVQRLDLEEAERLAIQNHPRLQSARFQAEAARAQVQQIKGSMSPFLAGNVTGSAADHLSRLGAGGLNASSLFSRFGLGIGVTQLLYDFGRTNQLAEAAKLRSDAQYSAADAVRAELLFQVQLAYIRVLAAQQALGLAGKTLETRQLTRKQVQALTENQLRSTVDLQFAEVAVSEAEVLLARLEGERQAADAVLATAIGFSDERRFQLEELPAPDLLPDSADPLVREAMQTRPELAGRRQQAQAAQQVAKSESRLFLPSVAATGAFGFVPAGDPRLNTRYGGLGVNINFPMLNGNTLAARRSEAEARLRSANADTQEAELRIVREVRTAYAEARNAERSIALADRQLEQSNRLLKLAQARYQAGLGTIVEINQAELARFTAELGATNARYGVLSTRAVLDYSMGRLR